MIADSDHLLYEQTDKGAQAVAHICASQAKDDEALFYLPVTKAWLRQGVLGLVLLCVRARLPEAVARHRRHPVRVAAPGVEHHLLGMARCLFDQRVLHLEVTELLQFRKVFNVPSVSPIAAKLV